MFKGTRLVTIRNANDFFMKFIGSPLNFAKNCPMGHRIKLRFTAFDNIIGKIY